ncbi:hypothetical protein D3C75_828440 [compost metagenome]
MSNPGSGKLAFHQLRHLLHSCLHRPADRFIANAQRLHLQNDFTRVSLHHLLIHPDRFVKQRFSRSFNICKRADRPVKRPVQRRYKQLLFVLEQLENVRLGDPHLLCHLCGCRLEVAMFSEYNHCCFQDLLPAVYRGGLFLRSYASR